MQSSTTTQSTRFSAICSNIIGYNDHIETPFGQKRIVYADWIASGRLYAPIERTLMEKFGPLVANTHTETTATGSTMTLAYHEAQHIIKHHVGASDDDALVMVGSGMTAALAKLHRILGLKVPEQMQPYCTIPEHARPVVFVTHMEHHSNQTSWLETICTVEIINPDQHGNVDLRHLDELLERYAARPIKIASVTSCSNVTGIVTPYHAIARRMHEAGGWCFVDFACSAPYLAITMHPENPLERLDAIFFSPHKFLGGPGTPGVLIFNKSLYTLRVPDQPGGGTVTWTNPWGEHRYIEDIETREDGGTPAFLQTIKAAMAIKLKESIGVEAIREREEVLVKRVFAALEHIPNLHLLAPDNRERIGVFSFYIDGMHYNLGVKLLNDRFGIQTRGGCSCAGTYGHFLLNLSHTASKAILCQLDEGTLVERPGWVRFSAHPTMSDEECEYVLNAIRELAAHHKEWANDYVFDNNKNEYFHKAWKSPAPALVRSWLEIA
ncbi:MAG: aminotransferase class V-fold PLP-dependent enzyme [Candidatus Kapabacteria bacterium]|jgi:selenocysteine lyase/cysteine desulfurase|nr:aminotransferase class V-fold PLP-dependent enzyme [Candidatus Kapabacteria bacterium]